MEKKVTECIDFVDDVLIPVVSHAVLTKKLILVCKTTIQRIVVCTFADPSMIDVHIFSVSHVDSS